MEKRKISCSTHRSRSRSFCVVVLQWTAMKYRFTEHTCTAFVLLFKPFVWWCLLTLWFTPDSIHTTPKEFKNAYSLYLRLGLRSRVIRHENGAFRKRSSNRRNLKTLALSFRVEGNILKRTISNTIGSGEPRDFPGRDFLKQKYKTTGDFCVTKFPRCTQCRRPGLSFLGS